jgi:hypothetical protein
MKIFSSIKITLVCVFAVFNLSIYNNIQQNNPQKLTIIVLPPYDEIANAGISPKVSESIEENIKDKDFSIMKFPFKKLMGVPYQNIFDKKFCKPILQKIKADVMIMSKIDQVSGTGNMETDKWNLRIRIYDVKNNKQKNSSLKGENLNPLELENFIVKNRKTLIKEIKNSR